MTTYFFDTFALIEMIAGNPNYLARINNVKVATTRMNLMEMYYSLMRKHDLIYVEKCYSALLGFCIDIDDETIKKACLFRHANKDKKFSYIDCIGYVIARTLNMKFLTGDNAFKGMEGVEFVK